MAQVGRTVLTLFLIVVSPALTPIQEQAPPKPDVPPWTGEESQMFNAATQAPDLAKQIQLAEEFLSKFTKSALAPLMQRRLIGLYLQPQAFNLKKAFEITKAYLAPPDPELRWYDLKDSASLAGKLREAKEPLSQYLRAQLSSEMQKLLDEYQGGAPPDAVLNGLIDDLNRLLRGPCLYEKDRFTEIALSEHTRTQVEHSPQGEDLLRLNRMLLEEAYPKEIASPAGRYPDAFQRIFGPPFKRAGIQLPMKPTDDLQLLLLLVNSANGEAKGRSHDHALDEQVLTYAQLALGVINTGGVPPTVAPANWTQGEKAINALVHQTIGLVKFHRQQYSEAIDSFQSAAQSDPSDPANFFLTGEAIRLSEYAKLADELKKMRDDYSQLTDKIKQVERQVDQVNQELSKLPDTQRNKPQIEELKKKGEELTAQGTELSKQAEEQAGKIDEKVKVVDQVVDRMIGAYAKTVARSDKVPDLQKTARAYLETYWKYRNQNTLDNLEDYIKKQKEQQ
jgi:hypothetical protein